MEDLCFLGGGWIFGGPKDYEGLVYDLVRETGAAVFFVDFTPSPEAVYPVPIEQSYSAVQWLLEHGEELGVNSTKMGFAGDSAGGTLAHLSIPRSNSSELTRQW